MYSQASPNKKLKKEIVASRDALKHNPFVCYFAMCDKEDLETEPNAKLYTDANSLLVSLSYAKTVYATRLHANVLAWIAGVPEINTIHYDPKIKHFFDRVEGLTPNAARRIMEDHLKQINTIVNV